MLPAQKEVLRTFTILRNELNIIETNNDWRQIQGSTLGARKGSSTRRTDKKVHSCLAELSEETKVIGVEVADIIDTVIYHRDPFYPHTEGKTGNLIWIVAYIA